MEPQPHGSDATIADFELGEVVFTGPDSWVVRARRREDARATYVKRHRSPHPTAQEIARFRRDHELGRLVGTEAAVEYLDLVRDGAGLAVITADEGLLPLDRWLALGRPDLLEAVRVCRSMAMALDVVHERGVVHGDVKPANAVLDRERGLVRWLDFGIAARIGRDGVRVASGDTHAGTLAYCAPEQTGRMNRTVDTRADLYALGVTFFEILTGGLPFRELDPLALVHAHLARVAPAARTIDPRIPAVLSNLVARLLVKDPDERYQTARGVATDLERIAEALATRGEAVLFPLASDDVDARLVLPQRLYGRSEALARMLDGLARASRGDAVTMLVSGHPGIGKSALVDELERPTVIEHGFFVRGRFEPFRRDVPFAALAQAIHTLLRAVSELPPARREATEARVRAALREDGRALLEASPDLLPFVHDAVELADVGPELRRTRLFRAVTRLLDAITGDDSVLLLCIDDLQWADEGSLALLAASLVNRPRTLLLLAYRDSEFPTTHPAAIALRAIEEKRGRSFENLALGPLGPDDVAAWLGDALHASAENVRDLGLAVHARTGGNPFHVRQLVMMLQTRGVLHFDRRSRRFDWDLDLLSEIELGDDVLSLLRGRLEALAPRTLELLRLASVVGAEDEVRTLARVTGADVSEVLAELAPALEEGLVRLREGGERYRFVHDRVQQAAYDGLDADARIAMHHRVGRALLERAQESSGEGLVEVALHLAEARTRARTRDERRELAQILLAGAERALASSAFEQAARLASLARESAYADGTPPSELGVGCAVVAANALVALTRHDELTALVRSVEAEGHPLEVLAPVHVAYLRALGHLRDPRESLARAGEVLVRYGIRIPESPGPRHLLPLVLRLYARLGKAPRRVEDLPETADPRALVETQLVLAILDEGWSLSPMHGVYFLLQIALRLPGLGRTAYAGVSVEFFGLAVATVFGDVKRARELCELGISLVRERRRYDLLPTASIGYLVLVLPWCEPLANTLDPLREGLAHAIDTGDSHNVAQYASVILFHRIFLGHELQAIAAEGEHFRPAVARERGRALDLEYILQFVECLRGEAPDPSRLRGPRFDVTVEIPRETDEPTRFGMALHDLMLAVFCGSEARLAESFAMADRDRAGARDIFMRALWPYYGGLALLAHVPSAGAARRRTLRRARAFVAELETLEALQAENVAHRTALLRAELARASGDVDDALDGYRRAVDAASRNGWLHELALSHEKAARFHLVRGDEVGARGHLEDSLYAYERWGARAKVDALLAEFPRQLARVERRRLGATTTSAPTVTTGGLGLDVVSVTRAAQALAGMIDRDSVVARLLELAAENAGARRGALVVLRDGEPHVEAAFEADDAGGRRLFQVGAPLDTAEPPLPEALVREVLASGRAVVLDDAEVGTPGRTSLPERTTRVGSAIAVPLSRSGEAIGALVLTNDLLTAAFTPARVTVLEVLASQAAISLENARLYAELERSLERQVALTEANRRFVPREFIASLGHGEIDAVALGDSVQKSMTVLFSDMRAFTSLVEGMSPEANIAFINEYLAAMEPAILEHGGFVDSYIGDAIMALFDGPAEHAIGAAVGMLERLRRYNEIRRGRGERELRIGIGINTGELTLGTIGGPQRIKCGVIGDPVNLGARIESATKHYGVSLLVGDATIDALAEGATEARFDRREVDRVRVRGRRSITTLYEVFDADAEPTRSRKRAHASLWRDAVASARRGATNEARALFARYAEAIPEDPVARVRLERLRDGVASDEIFELVEK